ncbi:MAG: hypothetical protein WCI27_03050 [Candidatus Omnitrophota bacterium]
MSIVAAATTNSIPPGLCDLRGPVSIPGDLLWILALAIIVITAGFAWAVFQWSKRSKPVIPVEIKPAWEIALSAMQELEGLDFIRQGRVKEYYSELSDIVRHYIEIRFDVRAPEMTTEEFMHVIRYSEKLTPAQQRFLERFLNASDMVKFAQVKPIDEDMKMVMNSARTFVEDAR